MLQGHSIHKMCTVDCAGSSKIYTNSIYKCTGSCSLPKVQGRLKGSVALVSLLAWFLIQKPILHIRHTLTQTNGVRWAWIDPISTNGPMQPRHRPAAIDSQTCRFNLAKHLESSESLIAPLFNLHLVWEHSETRVQLRPRETLLRALLQVNVVPPLDASQLPG